MTVGEVEAAAEGEISIDVVSEIRDHLPDASDRLLEGESQTHMSRLVLAEAVAGAILGP